MWVLPEVYSLAAVRLLEPGYELVAPDILYLELSNALLKAVRREQLEPSGQNGPRRFGGGLSRGPPAYSRSRVAVRGCSPLVLKRCESAALNNSSNVIPRLK